MDGLVCEAHTAERPIAKEFIPSSSICPNFATHPIIPFRQGFAAAPVNSFAGNDRQREDAVLPKIQRIFIVVLDGVGAGELPDAAQYGDAGSNTLAHTAQAVGGLHLPNMGRMGLGTHHRRFRAFRPIPAPTGNWGKMREASPGKDTITGTLGDGGSRSAPSLPDLSAAVSRLTMIAAFEQEDWNPNAWQPKPASGTVIIEELGAEHVRTGFPIVYTSADSVFQIAMHEAVIPIARQYEICEIARRLLTGTHEVGRVICRPFAGSEGCFKRTERRKDYPVSPPLTVLDELKNAKIAVHAIGKIFEIFNGRGITTFDHTTNNAAHIAALQQAAESKRTGLVFANLEDFDMLYGHRNDPQGMANALQVWDEALPALLTALRPGDLLLITADHGNDPTTPSTDHSREYPFLLACGPELQQSVDLGIRATYADIAASIRETFGLPEGTHGTSFLPFLLN